MAGSIVFPGVIVGKQAIVGAGSIVTKDVDAFAVVAGNPVRLIRRLDPEKFLKPEQPAGL